MNLSTKNETDFGIYIHIPYCLQICPYCDFAKYEVGKIPDQDHYTQLLIQEIRQKFKFAPNKLLSSIYFGGGTPSIMLIHNMRILITELRQLFEFSETIEITIEINPGNIDEPKLTQLMELGINRFSVGSQTFDDKLLDIIGRKHSSKETEETLNLLNRFNLNFSMDILFSLPHQTLDILKVDIQKALDFKPKHISTYYLNVPEKNLLSKNRANDEVQVEMFKTIERSLQEGGLKRYEISNYAIAGYESRHNLLYWKDRSYWGVGLSSHSFISHKDSPPWGTRFFNPKSYDGYQKYVKSLQDAGSLSDGLSGVEILAEHQSMTEFCYTSLRKMNGLNLTDFDQKFAKIPRVLTRELSTLVSRGLIIEEGSTYRLSDEGKILSNLVFERLTFLKEDLY